jgi:hypothetical protein
MPGQGRSKNVAKAESVDVADLIIEDVVMEPIIEEVITGPIVEEVKVEEKPVVVETPKVRYATGEVHNCGILKVRKVANAKSEVVTVINRGTQVQVDFEGSSETFYKVTVGKTSGFSMKAYIKIVE